MTVITSMVKIFSLAPRPSELGRIRSVRRFDPPPSQDRLTELSAPVGDSVTTKDIRFFESGLQLIHGEGGWRNALAELIQLVAESANSTSASFYVADWRQNVLKPAITYGLPPTYVDACGDVSIGDQCCGRAVLYRKPWVVSDMLSDPLFSSARDAALASPIRAGFSVPVIDGHNECIGSIGCHYAEPHTPSSADIERNEVWASVIAHTISQYMGSLASGSGK